MVLSLVELIYIELFCFIYTSTLQFHDFDDGNYDKIKLTDFTGIFLFWRTINNFSFLAQNPIVFEELICPRINL